MYVKREENKCINILVGEKCISLVIVLLSKCSNRVEARSTVRGFELEIAATSNQHMKEKRQLGEKEKRRKRCVKIWELK